MSVDSGTVFAYLAGIILLFFLGRFFALPVRVAGKLLFNSLIGGLVILAINFIGNFTNFNIALNFITALIIGVLGIPGFILIMVLKNIFNV